MQLSTALLFVLAATTCAVACSSADEPAALTADGGGATTTPDAAAPLQDVEVRFEARVGDRAFSCAETYALGTPAAEAVVRDVRSYVHDVQLIDGAGARVPLALTVDGLWQTDRVALLDFETGADNCRNGTPQVNSVIRGKAPRGTYRGVAFSIGVPADLNHTDPSLAASPLTLSTMQWTWNAGYIFLRVDAELVLPETDGGMDTGDAGMSMGDGGMHMGAPGAYLMHLGSAGCTGEASAGQPVTCSHANRGAVALEGFDPLTMPVVLDVGALFAGSNLAAPDQGGSPGCMSSPDDPECTVLLGRIGVDAVTGAPSAATQQAFRAP